MVYRCVCTVECEVYVDAGSEEEAEFDAVDYLDMCELRDAVCKCEDV